MKYIENCKNQFLYYKLLGEKAMVQVSDEKLFWQYNEDSNSIAIMVNHLAGNMLSRWTNFLTEDGEKEWRKRDHEFEDVIRSKTELYERWEEGWKCLFDALNMVNDNDLEKIIYIRNQGHTITDAVNRQLAHYAYHVGQIVFLAKMIVGEKWQSLSIPKGQSDTYNKDKFSRDKTRKHFTDEYLKKK